MGEDVDEVAVVDLVVDLVVAVEVEVEAGLMEERPRRDCAILGGSMDILNAPVNHGVVCIIAGGKVGGRPWGQ